MEFKNVQYYKADGPQKSGAVKLVFHVDPEDADKAGELMRMAGRGVPVDLTVKEAKDYAER